MTKLLILALILLASCDSYEPDYIDDVCEHYEQNRQLFANGVPEYAKNCENDDDGE